jgi:hypothetical protein
MADEPARTRPGEHDGANVWVAVDAVHQLLQLVGDVEAEQAVLSAVNPNDQHGSAILDLKVAAHGVSFHCWCNEVMQYYNEVTRQWQRHPRRSPQQTGRMWNQ